jgi:hypothetical protein
MTSAYVSDKQLMDLPQLGSVYGSQEVVTAEQQSSVVPENVGKSDTSLTDVKLRPRPPKNDAQSGTPRQSFNRISLTLSRRSSEFSEDSALPDQARLAPRPPSRPRSASLASNESRPTSVLLSPQPPSSLPVPYNRVRSRSNSRSAPVPPLLTTSLKSELPAYEPAPVANEQEISNSPTVVRRESRRPSFNRYSTDPVDQRLGELRRSMIQAGNYTATSPDGSGSGSVIQPEVTTSSHSLRTRRLLSGRGSNSSVGSNSPTNSGSDVRDRTSLVQARLAEQFPTTSTTNSSESDIK